MALCLLSRRAEVDLLGIARYTRAKWGHAQAERYLREMEARCEQIAASPFMGRVCDDIRPGLRRIEQGSHVIFYRVHADGIFVSRVLHQSMLPEQHNTGGDR